MLACSPTPSDSFSLPRPYGRLHNRSVQGLVPVELGAVTVPEDHRRRWATVNHVTKKLQKVMSIHLSLLSNSATRRLEELETSMAPALLCHFAAAGDIVSSHALAWTYPTYPLTLLLVHLAALPCHFAAAGGVVRGNAAFTLAIAKHTWTAAARINLCW